MTRPHKTREFTRVPATFGVEVTGGGKIISSSYTKDVSMKGVYLSCDDKLPIGTECRVVLFLGEGEELIRIRTFGRVGRTDNSGMAIEFTEIDVEGFEHLRNLVLLNTMETVQVEEEMKDHIGIKRPDK